ncbi:OmpA family protein [Streptomyces sp. NPDC001795]|uniref:OmpA family protein n=1 Tax=Streptomyces sp. NPDC001795 TaxID=3154525 RepID=UPI003328B944
MTSTQSSWRRRLAMAATLLTGLAAISLSACTSQQAAQSSPLLPAHVKAVTGVEVPWWAAPAGHPPKEGAKPPRTTVDTLRSSALFARDSSALSPRAEAALHQISRQATRRPDAHLTVDGYTDSDGSAEHGIRLSVERADAVAGWLIGHGVNASRITTHGWGEANPVVPNTSEENKAINRRVTITIRDTT